MKKYVAITLKIIIAVIIVGALLVGFFYYRSYISKSNEIADIVNKGNAFMDAQCYPEAIECYLKALEYNEKTDELKTAIASAYLNMAGQYGDTDDAIVCYENAIFYVPDDRKAYWNIANIYEGRGEEDTMMEVLRRGYTATGDEEMNTKVAGIEEERAAIAAQEEAERLEEEEKQRIEAERASKLEPLKELFINEDYGALKDMLRQEEYVAFSDEVIGDNSYYLGSYDTNGNRTGTGIAVYENGYYYYGEFADNVRSGHGILMRASYADSSSIGSFIYEGEWANDAPNGEGVATSNYYNDRISASDFVTKEISGNYLNGREDGTMKLKGKTKAGGTQNFTYQASGGIAEKSSNEDSGVDGQYIIAQNGDKSQSLTSDGSVRGVEGFIEE